MIQLQMTDVDVVERAAALIGVGVVFVRSKNPKHKDSYNVLTRGKRAAVLMRLLLPLMGRRRQGQIVAALAEYVPPKLAALAGKHGKILQLSKKGWSTRRIAKSVGTSHVAVWQVLQKHAP